MKGLGLYRVLSFLVGVISSFVGVFFLIAIMAIFSVPVMGIVSFILLSVILYSWYSRKFFYVVYIEDGVFTRRQKDWLQVNAIVAIIFSLYCIVSAVTVLTQPSDVVKAVEQLPEVFFEQSRMSVAEIITTLTRFFAVTLVACCILLVHITWTLILLRKHLKQSIKTEE